MNKSETSSRLRHLQAGVEEVRSACRESRSEPGMESLCEELETLLGEASGLIARAADLLGTTAG